MNGEVPARKIGRFGGLNSSCCSVCAPGTAPMRYCESRKERECRLGSGIGLRGPYVDRVAQLRCVHAIQNRQLVDELPEEL